MSSTINSGKIFNVDEVTGKDHAALETTAAEAQIHAPNRVEAMHIEENAEHTQQAAQQAAAHAKSLGSGFTGDPTTAVGQFKANASNTTNAAVAEGQHDVAEAKAVGAGYVEQAKAVVNTAIETVQPYLPTALGGKPTPANTAERSGPTTGSTGASTTAATVTTQAQNAASTAYATAATAISAAQPQVEKVLHAAQPYVENAKTTVQGYMGTAGTQGTDLSHNPSVPSTGPSATTAPLESGTHTVDGPYPPTGTNNTSAKDIAAPEAPAVLPAATRN